MRNFICGFVAAAVLFTTLLFVGSVGGGVWDERITGCGYGDYSGDCAQRKQALQQERQNQEYDIYNKRRDPC